MRKGAALKRYAQAGGFSLYNMTHELRAAHQGGGAFTTSLGHSYGSTPQGWAATTPGGIAVDRVVNLAGAGMGVNHVSQLRLAGYDPAENHQRVYALMDKGDILNVIHPFQQIGHGTMPHDPAFGAQRVAVEHHLPKGARSFWDALLRIRDFKLLTRNHGGYADEGSMSLRNIGKIIAGLDPELEG